MSVEDLVKDEEKKKKSFSVEKYMQQLQQIDMQNIGAWPLAVKITMYIFIVVLVGVLTYFVFIQSLQSQIEQAKAQETNLLSDFEKKNSDLRNAQAYKKQLEMMEAQFNQQLLQLPKQTEIPGLIDDVNKAGVRSDLKFKNIELLPENKQEIFIEQPIDIVVEGNYNNFGAFVTAIASLPRIVTLHDFAIVADPSSKAEVPKLLMTIKAKTYRYMTESEKAASDTEKTSGSSNSTSNANKAEAK